MTSELTVDSAAAPSGRPKSVRTFRRGTIETPIGTLTLLAAADRPGVLRALAFPGDPGMTRLLAGRGAAVVVDGGTELLELALRRYFDGDITALDSIEVDAEGSEFQKRVWAELRRIPAGTTVSYRELAERIGRPSAVRAVARANATNPVAIVVPCHRVVGADGSLRGYAGGVERKRWLLDHEARRSAASGAS